ncbi:FtsX-like permease family protein [Mucilaginibacter gotjawali]|uniref:Permease n=2 Tax=Mucilaginibacter gotjawali TaxID=1550579 RepID=A0A839S7M9_9SPHI|nr:FtsX-like permease family protein [Mucilaginibacter gotjawali]MBB3054121.1 putative permease [Mucilaginibacter gotjawali]BAU54389.1 putative ABC transporter permease YknZ [Mucilaginibacter gotjawali]
MIKNYFKIALRGFWKHKLFTLINIIGLSIGISTSLVIYLIVHYDLTFDKFHRDSDRIYRVVSNFSFQGQPGYTRGVCGPLPGAIKSQATGVGFTSHIFCLSPDVFIAGKKGGPTKFKSQDRVVLADDAYFKIFDYVWLAGSSKTALEAPNQVVLTSERARLYFPALSYDQMIGKVVTYDTLKATITGIVQTIKENTDLTFHDFISYSSATATNALGDLLQLKSWGSTSSSSIVFVKLSPQASAANVQQQLNDIFKKNNPPHKGVPANSSTSFALQPLNDLHFNEKYGAFDFSDTASKNTLYGLLVIAAFLLLLGCINFVNLTTAQAAQRAKEIGIRKTMGSSRAQLVIQFLSETFFITLFAVIISIVSAPLILKLFADFISPAIKADFIHQPDIILFLVVLVITVSLLSGFYPAIVLSGYKPVLVLKNQAQSNGSKTRNAWLRKSLTVSQFVIAQFFIMATVLVSKQIYYALHKDLGFKKDAIIVINSPWKARTVEHNLVLLNKLRAIPEIELVSIGNAAPFSGSTTSTRVSYKDGKKEIQTEVEMKFGDENYLKLYQIKLLAGRTLQASDTSTSFLINNTYARVLGFRDPHDAIGKQIDNINERKRMTIVGVMADFYERSIHSPIKPLAFLISKKDVNQLGGFHIALKPQTPGGDEWKTAIAAIGKAWKEIYPDDDFDYHFYDDTIAQFYSNEQHTSTLLTWASGLSIFISCLGLLGLAIYTTNQRTKEIGVRKVLGATVVQIVRMLSTELVLLILLAFAIVCPIAWYAMNKWMESFTDKTSISWWIFAASAIGMLLAAVITSSFQTVKAAIANPVKSLRSE